MKRKSQQILALLALALLLAAGAWAMIHLDSRRCDPHSMFYTQGTKLDCKR